MTITTRLSSFFTGKCVGQDAFGNHYYTQKRPAKHGRTKRWVLYNGMAEPSKIPPEWHGWMHYTVDTPPTQKMLSHYDWEKTPQPNLTGTVGAYMPGSLSAEATRPQTTADYQAWTPQ